MALFAAALVGADRWARQWGSAARFTTAGTAAVILTGAVLVWYTWETRELAREARKQNELQVLPFVILEPHGKDPNNMKFGLRNIGRGAALNVRILEIEIGHGVTLRMEHSIPWLGSNADQRVDLRSYVDGKPIQTRDFFTSNIKPEYANRRIEIVVQFQDVNFNTMEAVQSVDRDTFEIQGFRRARARARQRLIRRERS